MTEFVRYVPTDEVCEVLAEWDIYYWVLRDGSPDTLPKMATTPYTPSRGDVVHDSTSGQDVVVLGDRGDGRVYVVPLGAGEGDAVGVASPDQLQARRKPRRRPAEEVVQPSLQPPPPARPPGPPAAKPPRGGV